MVVLSLMLSEHGKEKLISELVKAGAIRRDKPLQPGDEGYSCSLGEKGLPVLEIKI
jgi:hypothetical protein